MLLQFRDVGSSFCTFVLVQTWLTVFTILVSICSISFFTYGPADGRFALDLSYIGFLIILPTLMAATMAFARREAALKELAAVKSGLLWVWLRSQRSSSRRDDGSSDSAVQETMWALTEALRVYLLTPRFYTHSYPYTGVRPKMVGVAQERGRHLRRATACFIKLSQLCQGCDDQLQQVHVAFERMANIKEYRLPQHLRSVLRFGVPVLVPVFLGPFWSNYYFGTRSFAFALLIGTLLNVVLVAMLNISIELEDPFDNLGLDGIYCNEPLHELEEAILMDADEELRGPPPRAARLRTPTTNGISHHERGAAGAADPEAAPMVAPPHRGGSIHAHFMDDVPLSTDL